MLYSVDIRTPATVESTSRVHTHNRWIIWGVIMTVPERVRALDKEFPLRMHDRQASCYRPGDSYFRPVALHMVPT